MNYKPSWSNLTPTQQSAFGNGVGAKWFPKAFRKWLTNQASFFFQEACWRHHDFGYYTGRTEIERSSYDLKFLKAMLRDSLKQRGLWRILSYSIAILFYLSVVCGGWLSFHYSKNYRRLQFK